MHLALELMERSHLVNSLQGKFDLWDCLCFLPHAPTMSLLTLCRVQESCMYPVHGVDGVGKWRKCLNEPKQRVGQALTSAEYVNAPRIAGICYGSDIICRAIVEENSSRTRFSIAFGVNLIHPVFHPRVCVARKVRNNSRPPACVFFQIVRLGKFCRLPGRRWRAETCLPR